jgi:hypothetical protein
MCRLLSKQAHNDRSMSIDYAYVCYKYVLVCVL